MKKKNNNPHKMYATSRTKYTRWVALMIQLEQQQHREFVCGVVADTNYLYPARWGWIKNIVSNFRRTDREFEVLGHLYRQTYLQQSDLYNNEISGESQSKEK